MLHPFGPLVLLGCLTHALILITALVRACTSSRTLALATALRTNTAAVCNRRMKSPLVPLVTKDEAQDLEDFVAKLEKRRE